LSSPPFPRREGGPGGLGVFTNFANLPPPPKHFPGPADNYTVRQPPMGRAPTGEQAQPPNSRPSKDAWAPHEKESTLMFVNHNIFALDAQRNLEATGSSLAKSVERLSSGLRINRAADDAAGLSISEKLRSQVRGLDQAQRNAQDGISMIQTAEGAMNEVHDMLQRMRELSLQAANDTLTGNDRGAINTELQQLKQEIDGVRDSTKFNGKALLTGALATTLDTANSTAQAGTVVVAGTNTSISSVNVAA